jgi:hypothetical protein
MSRSIALSLLAQGNTGNEILQILDGLVESSDDSSSEVVEFWCNVLCALWLTLEGTYVRLGDISVLAVFLRRSDGVWGGVAPVYKNSNYPNLQRWQIDL